MIILGFDISSASTGWAVLKDGKPIQDGYGLILPNKKHSLGQRLEHFASELNRLIDNYSPDKIIIEEIFCGFNKVSFKVLAMYRGVAIHTIYNKVKRDPISLLAVEVRGLLDVPIKKEDAFECIMKKYKLNGFDFEKHNDIVDAFALCFAVNLGKEVYEKPVRSSGRRQKRGRKNNKKRISKTRTRKTSRSK